MQRRCIAHQTRESHVFYQGMVKEQCRVGGASEGQGGGRREGEGGNRERAPAGSLDEFRVDVNAQHAERCKVVHSSQRDDALIAAYVQAPLAMEPAPVQHLQGTAHTSDRHAATSTGCFL